MFELSSSHLFRNQPYKEVLEVKCQAAFLQVLYPLREFLRIVVLFLRPVFCRTSYNMICNNFVILKHKTPIKMLEIGGF